MNEKFIFLTASPIKAKTRCQGTFFAFQILLKALLELNVHPGKPIKE